MNNDIYKKLDEMRMQNGFLTIEDVLKLAERGNVVFDPFSVLIAREAEIGTGNVFYPGVVLSCGVNGALAVGSGNTFMTGCLLCAEGGSLSVGNSNYFGDGSVTLKADGRSAYIRVGSECRITGGAQIYGSTELGNGAQVLGGIKVQDCRLEAGGSYRTPNPDLRGAVLKGAGAAKGLVLHRGQVISGAGIFKIEDVKMQSFFHPDWKE